jgi:hypothetical protein
MVQHNAINRADIAKIDKELKDKKAMLIAIYHSLENFELPPLQWDELIRQRNEVSCRIEILKRKLEAIRISGKFNGSFQQNQKKYAAKN